VRVFASEPKRGTPLRLKSKAPHSRKQHLARLLWLSLTLCFPSLTLAQTVPPVATAGAGTAASAASLGERPTLQLTRHRLANGLRVVLNEDHSAPTVAVAVTYDVGARNEELGRSGFAHLFEHLMFQGSSNVDKGQHFQLLAARGGRSNGTTNKDRTNYYEVLPAHELELALWLEADRMRSLALNRKNFENQRDVVLEEYRLRYSSRVYALGRLRLHQLVFQNYWAYEHPVIGFMEDLENAEYEWVRDFHQRYYAPNNAVLSVVGDFDPTQAMKMIERHFGRAEARANIPEFVEPARLPHQSSERLSVIVDHSAKTPGVYFGWRIPPARTAEHRALEVAAETMAGGDSSRLHRALVIDKASASRVSAWASPYRGPSAFQIFIQVAAQSSVDAAQTWLDAELTRLRVVGPTDAELIKAKARLKTRKLLALESTKERAIKLGEAEVFWGDAGTLNEEFDAYDGVTIAAIRAAASKYLIDTKRSIVEIYPPGWVRDIGPPIITRTHIVKKGETLSGIAVRYATTTDALAKQNGIKRTTHVRIGQRLLVTVKAGSGAKSETTYTVKKGDTLIGIAKKFKVSADDIAKANRTNTKQLLMPDQKLVIPRGGKTKNDAKGAKSDGDADGGQSAPPGRTHTVRKGDTLSGIAVKYGVSATAIAKLNRFSTKKRLLPGQKLAIPAAAPSESSKSGSKTPAKAAPSPPQPKPERTYTVKKGDTLSGIAHKYGLSSRDIAKRNGLSVKKSIRPGQKLTIPNAP
jgi:predicted Zn-dependent peptidase/LysM repeat protein